MGFVGWFLLMGRNGVRVGDWVEINYFNEGLQIHPMHLHGLPQLVIGEDGYPLASPYTVAASAVPPNGSTRMMS